MISLFLGLILSAFFVIIGILLYQHKNIKKFTNEKGIVVDLKHDPLSRENIHKMSSTLISFIKAEVKVFLFFILRFLIKLRKTTKNTIDSGIRKIARLLFPEDKLEGPIDENMILGHVEDQKKNGQKGEIHL